MKPTEEIPFLVYTCAGSFLVAVFTKTPWLQVASAMVAATAFLVLVKNNFKRD